MSEEISFADLVHIQPYLYIVKSFLDNTISPREFETIFLDLRRNDNYLMTGRFNSEFESLIHILFNAVDDYAPSDLYDPSDELNITEAQLRERVEEVLKKLEKKGNF